MISLPARANDLVVEGSLDETPAEIKKLSTRAASLEARIREIEQRIAESQQQILGPLNTNSVEYRIEMKLAESDIADSAKRNIAVSHVRLSIDGRPFSYTQSVVIISHGSPLPLFLGRITEGNYLMRIQFQAAPVDERIANSATAAWQTVERTIPVEIVAEAGSKQVQSLGISMGSDGLKFDLFKKTALERPTETRKVLEKM